MILSRPNFQRPQTAPPAIAMLARAGLDVEQIDAKQYRVGGEIGFWPQTGYWRAIDGSRQGYGVRTLIAAARPAP